MEHYQIIMKWASSPFNWSIIDTKLYYGWIPHSKTQLANILINCGMWTSCNFEATKVGYFEFSIFFNDSNDRYSIRFIKIEQETHNWMVEGF